MYTIVPNNRLFFDKFDPSLTSDVFFEDYNSDVKRRIFEKMRIFDQKIIQVSYANTKRHLFDSKAGNTAWNVIKCSLGVFKRSVEMIYIVWKWFEKKFFWDVWLQNRLESWLKIRIFRKFFLHVFKHQKIFQKNQSDKISHKKLT